MDIEKRFIVISLTESPNEDCSVVPEDEVYATIYSRVFGPATEEECLSWIKSNCGANYPLQEQEQEQVQE